MVKAVFYKNTFCFFYKSTGDKVFVYNRDQWESMEDFYNDYSLDRTPTLPAFRNFINAFKPPDSWKGRSPSEEVDKVKKRELEHQLQYWATTSPFEKTSKSTQIPDGIQVEAEQKSVEQVYEDHWKGIIEAENGALRADQVKRELYDYLILIQRVTMLYDRLSRGELSSPTADPAHILAAVDRRINQGYMDGVQDTMEKHSIIT